MKAAFTLALAAASASAQTVNETFQECWLGQGANYIKKCVDAYYNYCDKLEIWAGDRCNIYTFSDTRLVWDSSQIYASTWSYYLKDNVDSTYEVTGWDMSPTNDNSGCYLIGDGLPEPYDNGSMLNLARSGMCGFKINVENTDIGPNPITVLKDGAAHLMAGSVVALAAVLAF